MDKNKFIAMVEQHCQKNSAKLTGLRREVLELVLEYEGVVKAYQVLNDMQRKKGKVAPPTVYRALDFLVEQGVLHRIEALNGFLVCQHLDCDHAHEGLILSCENCGKVIELYDGSALLNLRNYCKTYEFNMAIQNIVILGSCDVCMKKAT